MNHTNLKRIKDQCSFIAYSLTFFHKLLLIITHEQFFAYMINELGWWGHGLDEEDIAIPGTKLSAIN